VKFDSISVFPIAPGDKDRMKMLVKLLVPGLVPAIKKAALVVSDKWYLGDHIDLPFKTTTTKRQNMMR
jgi:hypothetical protein